MPFKKRESGGREINGEREGKMDFLWQRSVVFGVAK
jgi:hypothetical protein